jgi:hypothetical protein
MPGLAVISIHGKPVKDVTANVLAAVLLDQPMPPNTVANFYLNFSTYIEQINAVKWHYIEMSVPLVQDNTLALAALPPLSVLPNEVYPSAVSSQQASRRVDWNLNARVVIAPAGYNPLSLTGNTLSYAEFNWDGSIAGGCTNCGASETTLGGAISVGHGPSQAASGEDTGTPSYTWYLTNPVDFCAHNPSDAKCKGPTATGQLVTEVVKNTVAYTTAGTTIYAVATATVTRTGTATQTQPQTQTQASPTESAVTVTAISTRITVTSGGSVTTETVMATTTVAPLLPTSITVTTSGAKECTGLSCKTSGNAIARDQTGAGYGSTTGGGIQTQQSYAYAFLPLGSSIPLTWTRLDMGSEVYLVNPGILIIAAFFVLAFVAIIWSRKRR